MKKLNAEQYFEKGNYQEAIADYNKAIELKPKYTYFYYNRGLSYRGLGKEEALNINWTIKESVRAKLKVIVKRTLRK